MNDIKPILFNTDMVRAILAGVKTVTRRVVKPQPPENIPRNYLFIPPYRPDDILYVRETWAKCSCSVEIEKQESPDFYWPKSVACDACRPHMGEDNPYVKWIDRKDGAIDYGCYLYISDLDGEEAAYRKWRPSIHMPKEAARLFLRVTAVRVERLQDMTEDDVFAEGAGPLCECPDEHTIYYPEGGMEICWNVLNCANCPIDKPYPVLFGERVWNSTIKKSDFALYGWEANPWVWVIEFEMISKEEAEA